MLVTEEQLREFEKSVIDRVLKELGLCVKCAHPGFRYTHAQVIARYKLMKGKHWHMYNSFDLNKFGKVIEERHKCQGCLDLRLACLWCLLFLLKDLNIYDRKRKL